MLAGQKCLWLGLQTVSFAFAFRNGSRHVCQEWLDEGIYDFSEVQHSLDSHVVLIKKAINKQHCRTLPKTINMTLCTFETGSDDLHPMFSPWPSSDSYRAALCSGVWLSTARIFLAKYFVPGRARKALDLDFRVRPTLMRDLWLMAG